ncbi:MAG: hypothetical protein ACFFBH_02885 [Promethearchaeota archaeon]
MPKNLTVILKSIGRKWFFILVIIIIIVAVFDLQLGIWITVITLILYGLSYIPNLLFSNKLKRFLKNQNTIDDKMISRQLKRKYEEIQKRLFKLSQNQKKESWLIVFLNKQYIFYNGKIIETFKELYEKGFGEKEILEELQKINVNTRAEIKAIEETLIKNDRLNERIVSVKEFRDKKKFG